MRTCKHWDNLLHNVTFVNRIQTNIYFFSKNKKIELRFMIEKTINNLFSLWILPHYNYINVVAYKELYHFSHFYSFLKIESWFRMLLVLYLFVYMHNDVKMFTYYIVMNISGWILIQLNFLWWFFVTQIL